MEISKSFLLVVITLFSVACSQHCNNLTIQEAESFINTNLPGGDNSNTQSRITQWIINCLATSGQVNKYRWVSFTANFTVASGEVYTGQGDINCINTPGGDQWDTAGTYSALNAAQFNARITAPPRTDCYSCAGALGGSDSLTHCSACHSNCLGNDFCSGSGSHQCCNYFDRNNMCTLQCGTNQHPNSSNFCECDTFYTGSDCSTCSIECSNGGLRNLTSCTCDCRSTGYNGSTCTQDIDECLQPTNPCQNDATCNNINGSYTCTCAAGYTDYNCSTNINDCDPNPCNDRGNCTDGIDTYTCACIPGYTGNSCETDINECLSNPCDNSGTCMESGINSYTCHCTSGYTGNNCETNINECASSINPCNNGGTCNDNIGSFTCTCQGGWTGDLCQTCFISNVCTRPHCNGSYTRCNECMNGYSLVNGSCVSCSVKDCTQCIVKDNCTQCGRGLTPSDDGLTCNPAIVTEPPTREKSGGINSGAIIGIVAAFFIILIIIVIVIAIVIVVLGKINKEKPPTYNVKTPKPEDKDIILTKISNI